MVSNSSFKTRKEWFWRIFIFIFSSTWRRVCPRIKLIRTEYWLVSVGVYASPPHIPSKTCKSKFAQWFNHAWAVWKTPQRRTKEKERNALSETVALSLSEHRFNEGISFAESPIGHEGSVGGLLLFIHYFCLLHFSMQIYIYIVLYAVSLPNKLRCVAAFLLIVSWLYGICFASPPLDTWMPFQRLRSRHGQRSVRSGKIFLSGLNEKKYVKGVLFDICIYLYLCGFKVFKYEYV